MNIGLVAWQNIPEGGTFPRALVAFGRQTSLGYARAHGWAAGYLVVLLPVPIYRARLRRSTCDVWRRGWFVSELLVGFYKVGPYDGSAPAKWAAPVMTFAWIPIPRMYVEISGLALAQGLTVPLMPRTRAFFRHTWTKMLEWVR